MDREFGRLEKISEVSTNAMEQQLVSEIQELLTALDQLWIEMDAGDDVRRHQLQADVNGIQGQIIQKAQLHRMHRFSAIGGQFGIEDPAQLRQFGMEIERAFRDTDFDWADLLNRGK